MLADISLVFRVESQDGRDARGLRAFGRGLVRAAALAVAGIILDVTIIILLIQIILNRFAIKIYAKRISHERGHMTIEAKRIRVHIATKDKDHKPISAAIVAENFQKIQNIIYYIVDDLEGNVPRRGGDFPNSVKEKSELVLTGMRFGSIEAELTISNSQPAFRAKRRLERGPSLLVMKSSKPSRKMEMPPP